VVRVVIIGAAGRMGAALIRCASRLECVALHGAVDNSECGRIGEDAGIASGIEEAGVPITDDLAAACNGADVTIDFTFHTAVPGSIRTAAQHGVAGVIGTTGLTEDETAVVHEAAAKVPIVWAPNMSLGVNLLFAMTRKAASLLDESYDIEICETHHRHKKDAPSGTALRLAEKAAAGRNVDLDRVAIYGRHGDTGERPAGEIAIHSLRSGDVVGDHVVSFATEGERIELVHRASSRDTFANGALHAAQWVGAQTPGLYDMQDILGLS